MRTGVVAVVLRIVVLLIAVLALMACGSAGTAEPQVARTAGEEPASSGRVATAASTQAKGGFPVTIENCGETVIVEAPPRRALTMNQAATEVMLALGLEERMVGTAYLDDAVLPELQAAYERVPVVSDQYPSPEVVRSLEPDFIYASYVSAFEETAAGPRSELATRGIASYLSPADCKARSERIEWADIFGEIRDVGAIFGVVDRAEALVGELEERLAAAERSVPAGVSVFWFDSGTKTPYVGACCGAPGLIMRTLGLTNVFDDLEGGWAEATWERVVEADPDAIVLVDAEWDPLPSKREVLSDDPLASLRAVRQSHFVEVPFSSTTPGIRNVSAVETLARALASQR